MKDTVSMSSTGEARACAHVVRGVMSCLLAGGLVAGPASARAQTPALDAVGNEQKGRSLYEQGRFAEAARAFENERTAKGLYNAGMARHGAGHDALAVDRWRRYAEQAPASELEELQQRIARVQKNLTKVRFVADATSVARQLTLAREGRADDAWTATWPAGQVALELELDLADWTVTLNGGAGAPTKAQVQVTGATEVSLVPTPVVTPVLLRVGPARALRRGVSLSWSGPSTQPSEVIHTTEVRKNLPPGTWRITAGAAGYETQEGVVRIPDGPKTLDLSLGRDPAARARIGLAAGLAVSAGILVAAGVVLMASGRRAFETERGCWDAPARTCQALSDARYRSVLGAGLLGGGVGAVVPAANAGRGARRRALAIEAGIGAALLAGGLAGHVTDATHTREGAQGGDGLALSQVAGGALGAGSGMFLGAVIGAIVDRAAARRRRR